MTALVNVTGAVTPEFVAALNENFSSIDDKLDGIDVGASEAAAAAAQAAADAAQAAADAASLAAGDAADAAEAAASTDVGAIVPRVTALESAVGDAPTGLYSGAMVIINEGGWIVGILDPAEIVALQEALAAAQEDLEEIAWVSQYMMVWSTNGRDLWVNEGGWVTRDSDAEIEALQDAQAGVATNEADARVAAIHGVEVEAAPFIAGDNLVFSWGESKAVVHTKIKTYLDQLVAAYAPGNAYPTGASVSTAQYHLGGQTMAENMTASQLALMRSELDAGFTAGAEAVTAWTLVEQANDMIRKTTVEQWEADIRRALDIIRRDSLQRYVGTDPDALVPVPPVIMPAECGAWAGYGGPELQPDIMLHAIQLSHEIYNLCIAFPDYIWTFDADNLHDTDIDTDIAAAYCALAIFYWRVLGKKYHPTQVREWWFDGSSAYLRLEMPQAPLVSDTSRVTVIDNEGLTAYQADGTPIAITGVTIVGGGRILKVDQAGDWVAGDRIWIAMVGDGGSGRTDGPRSTLHDSSTYTVTIGGSPFPLYSYLLPYKITL